MSVSQAAQLPSMPGTVVRLLQLFDDPDIDIRDVAALLKTDAALTVRILRAANNSSGGLNAEVTDLHQAAVLLGRKKVSCLALSFSLLDHSLSKGSDADLFQSFWNQSLLTGVAAATLCRSYGGFPPEEAFLVGLLSHIGRLGALTFASDDYRTAVRLAQLEAAEVDQIRLPHVNVNCQELTLQYLQEWALPKIFCQSIAAMQQNVGNEQQQFDDRGCLLKIAAAIGQFSIGENRHAALETLHRQMEKIDSDYESIVSDLLNQVVEEAQQYGQLLNFDTSSIENPAELRNQAMAQLTEIMLIPDDQTSVTANAAEVGRLKERVSELSRKLTFDPMTNIHNRSYFEDQLQLRCANACREQQWVSVLFVDINDFKRINDQYGHDVGDSAIKEVASVLKSHVRRHDIVARYGGDEFVVLCECNQEGGLSAQATRLAARLSEIFIHCQEHDVKVSVALGGATGIPAGDEFGTRIVRAADKAMYEAKESGINPKTRVIGVRPNDSLRNSANEIAAEPMTFHQVRGRRSRQPCTSESQRTVANGVMT